MAVAEADEDIQQNRDGDESSEAKPKNKFLSGKRLVLFVALPLLLIIAGGAGAYFAGLFDSSDHAATAEEQAEAEAEARRAHAIFYDLPDMLVNLNSTGRRSNFLKISISLELEDSGDISRVEAVLPRIIDNFQVYLRELRIEDLRGSAGVARLREELLMRIKIAARPAKINDVLFREMLVQ